MSTQSNARVTSTDTAGGGTEVEVVGGSEGALRQRERARVTSTDSAGTKEGARARYRQGGTGGCSTRGKAKVASTNGAAPATLHSLKRPKTAWRHAHNSAASGARIRRTDVGLQGRAGGSSRLGRRAPLAQERLQPAEGVVVAKHCRGVLRMEAGGGRSTEHRAKTAADRQLCCGQTLQRQGRRRWGIRWRKKQCWAVHVK